MARTYQEGRSTKKVLPSTFNFTANWFKESGIYDLKEYENEFIPARIISGNKDIQQQNRYLEISFQEIFMDWFCIDRKCKAGSRGSFRFG